MISDSIQKLINRQNLAESETLEAMNAIMEGEATPAQIAAFIVALRMKGETSEEVCGFAKAMRQHSIKVNAKQDLLVDTCGTGGDKLNTFNISTTAAFIAAGAGVPIAKHGNRAASSRCGSADVLETLGLDITVGPEKVAELIDEIGIGFMFAPSLHPAMKHAAAPRKELGIRTVFNILGPLTNPAGAKRQVLGVFDEWGCELLAGALARLGSEKALVVHGRAGLDEIATFGETIVYEIENGNLSSRTINASCFGLSEVHPSDIEGGEPNRNAAIFLEVLGGGNTAAREIACLNAGAAIYVAGKAKSIEEGLKLADESVRSGRAMDIFKMYKDRAGKQ